MSWTSYKDLAVWQKAMDLTDEIYSLIGRLPKEERNVLSDQMRRAVVSIPSNIAEGHGRLSTNEFRNFLSIANGSCMELETQLQICARQGYLHEEEVESAISHINEISKILTSFMFLLK